MKIKPEHYNHIKRAISKVLAANPNAAERYEKGDFPRASVAKDRQIRFNFDLFRAAVPSAWVCDNLYPYINDQHINTALRSICPKLNIGAATSGNQTAGNTNKDDTHAN